ncbi:hypothetical protein [Nonomuraea sp. NPDC049141]|uniref:hypothetical protein n=1 Tax=Nonomuraea sp. NPDC049141 TaxID=3155500 RepID=UPI0033CF0BA5
MDLPYNVSEADLAEYSQALDDDDWGDEEEVDCLVCGGPCLWPEDYEDDDDQD